MLRWSPVNIACITGALWAQRGGRSILREARDEGRISSSRASSKMPRSPRLAYKAPVMQATLIRPYSQLSPWVEPSSEWSNKTFFGFSNLKFSKPFKMKQNSLPAYLAGETKGANENGGFTLEREDACFLPSRVIFHSLAILTWRDGVGVGSHLWANFDPVSPELQNDK